MRRRHLFLLLGALMMSGEGRAFRVHALQPQWTVSDYVSASSFQQWMQKQLSEAQVNFELGQPNLVVLTELNGLPLALRGSLIAQQAPTLQLALAASLVKHLPESAYHALTSRVDLVQGLMLALAPENMQLYLRTCADLARKHGVYLLCGSNVHAHLEVANGRVQLAGPDLYNQAVLLGPQGQVLGAWDKVHLTADEYPLGMKDGKLEDLVTVATRVGDIGVATSLDAFREDVIRQLEDTGTTVLLQPDANAAMWTGEEHGTSTRRPQPVAWLDSSWSVVQKSPSIQYAINPMVVGNLFDVSFDGQTAIIGKAEKYPKKQGYVLTEPRAGFIALLPWVEKGDAATLKAVGEQLQPGSGSFRENRYRTGVVSANLNLPPSTLPAHELRPFEQAMQAVIDGKDIYNPSKALSYFWWVLGFGVLISTLGRKHLAWKLLGRLLGVLLLGIAAF